MKCEDAIETKREFNEIQNRKRAKDFIQEAVKWMQAVPQSMKNKKKSMQRETTNKKSVFFFFQIFTEKQRKAS